jgi:hypothetical protein
LRAASSFATTVVWAAMRDPYWRISTPSANTCTRCSGSSTPTRIPTVDAMASKNWLAVVRN